MFGPNLHGDAAAGGASKIDLRGHWEAGTGSLWSEPDLGRDPPARQTRLGMRQILINLYLPAMTGSSENILV